MLVFVFLNAICSEAQKCYCGAENCRGYIGLVKPSQTKQTNKKEKKKKKDIFKDELVRNTFNITTILGFALF